MPKMSPPHSTAVVTVNDDDVQRYKDAGWTQSKSGSASPSETSKKSTAKRSSDRK